MPYALRTTSRRGVHRPLSAIQLFAITALMVSTTTHWAIVVLQRFGGLLSHPGSVTVCSNRKAFLPQECVGTATLTINVRRHLALLKYCVLPERFVRLT